jgi:ribosome-associated heat shock protein Hsp15
MNGKDNEKLRLDKWLWSVRLFKTRSLATEACAAGKVKVDGKGSKASHPIKIGETISYRRESREYVYKVISLITTRVGAPQAIACYEDLSPPPPPDEKAIKKGNSAFLELPQGVRKRGSGRPTKRERRDIDEFLD